MPGSPEQRLFSNPLEETQHLKTITRSLLLLAQADAGQLKLALQNIDLSSDLQAMVEDAHILATDSQLRFESDTQPNLRVQADRGLLHMALMNLIKNAVLYYEPSGSVGLRLATQGEQIVLTICNTGPGIPAADQDRVFDRFYRGDRSHGQRPDGLGLGLSLAREIIQAHEGKLFLKESRPGHTCFTVCLKQAPTP